MVLQFADSGNFRNYLENSFSSLTWSDKLRMAIEIANGLMWLHAEQIIHRDLHDKNVLVHQGRMMIADLGLSKELNNSSLSITSALFGMPAFIEPQCFLDDKYKRNKKSDIYSLGNLLWEITSGHTPFESYSIFMISSKIMLGERENPVDKTPLEYVELYQQCWDNDPNNRPDIQNVFEKLNQISLQFRDNDIDNNQEISLYVNEISNNNRSFQSSSMDDILQYDLQHELHVSSHIEANQTISTENQIISEESNNNDNELFRYKGNRRYINLPNVNCLYPVDHDESDRLQCQHYIYYSVWKSHFSAPINDLLNTNGTKVLDVGCGPAIWTLEVATEYPNAQFTGIDIAAIYPIYIKPHNVEFIQANIFNGLPYEDNTFDYVFCRSMIFSFTLKNWEFVIKEICRVCKFGGYIEFMEKDIIYYNEGDFTKKARERFVKSLRSRKNIEAIISPKICQYISEVKHLSKINHEVRKIPIGEWGAEIGKGSEYIFKWTANNLKNVMIECGYNRREWDLMVERSIRELNRNRGYDKISRIWAKKGFL